MTASRLLQAVEYLERGDWASAHAIAQQESNALGHWVHGIVHLMEGDIDNARYWYRLADRPPPDQPTASAEIAALRSEIERA